MHRYALQFIDPHGGNTWVDITVEEMKKLIGFMFLMGIIYMPVIPMYWSTRDLLNIFFYKIKLSNHLQLILKFLHFNDNSFYEPNNENQDCLYKEEPHTEILCEHCMHVYALKLKLKVDESQMLFKC